MTNQELGAMLLSTTLPSFVTLSMGAIIFAFAIKLLFEDSSFEHLKIMSAIIALAFTLTFSAELYKAEQVYEIDGRIISIKTSSLNETEKENYIKELEKDITSLKNLDVSIILGLAKFMILGMIFIIIRDIIPKIIRFRKKKHNKILEEKQVDTCDNSSISA